jgi:hypothetical protein
MPEYKIGQVRFCAPPGEQGDNLHRVVQEIHSNRICGGFVRYTERGLPYIQYLTYGTWEAAFIGDLIEVWNTEQLNEAFERGILIGKK